MERSTDKCSRVVFTLTAHVNDSSIDEEKLCFCVVDIRDSHDLPWVPIGTTRPVNISQNLAWTEEFPATYKFECKQELRVAIFRLEEGQRFLIGHCAGDLNKFLSSLSKLTLVDSENNETGMVFLRCDEVVESKQKILIELRCEGLDDLDTFDKSDPFLMIYRQSPGGWVLIHETKVIMNNLNPQWDPIILDYSHFCHCDPSLMINIEVYDWDSPTKKEFIGKVSLLAGNFQTGAVFPIINAEKTRSSSYTCSGRLVIVRSEIVLENSFIDYIRGGMSLNLTVAIDYTASNGLATINNSLHYVESGHVNEYERVIRTLGGIISDYDTDKRFPVFGFGGLPSWLGKISHDFALNRHEEDPYIHTYEEIINTYKSTLCSITLRGPTLFGPILRKQINMINTCRENVYHILLMITDGELDDLDETIDLIIEGSRLPLSILIVGVGTERFLNMERLDGDSKELANKKGEKCARDIVQFVNFRKYKSDIGIFAREALMEIPTQLMNYMKLRNHNR